MKRSMWVTAVCVLALGAVVLVPGKLSAASNHRAWDCSVICPGGSCSARGWNCVCHCDGSYPHCYCDIAF
jgi:hypothetical protein